MVERQTSAKSGPPADFWSGVWEPFRNLGQQVANIFAPSSDAFEKENAYIIEVELPGVAEDDIDVSVRDDRLVVKGEKKDEREEKGDHYFFSERTYGAFQRAFRLPADVDRAKIDAHFENGVLRISMPRNEPKAPAEQKIKIGKK